MAHYQSYKFNSIDLKHVEAITENKFPYVNLRDTEDLLYYYRTHTGE